jgi:hypothetical protein
VFSRATYSSSGLVDGHLEVGDREDAVDGIA